MEKNKNISNKRKQIMTEKNQINNKCRKVLSIFFDAFRMKKIISFLFNLIIIAVLVSIICVIFRSLGPQNKEVYIFEEIDNLDLIYLNITEKSQIYIIDSQECSKYKNGACIMQKCSKFTGYFNCEYIIHFNKKLHFKKFVLNCQTNDDKCKIYFNSTSFSSENLFFYGYDIDIEAIAIQSNNIFYDSYLGNFKVENLIFEQAYINTSIGDIAIQTNESVSLSTITKEKQVCTTCKQSWKDSNTKISNLKEVFEEKDQKKEECFIVFKYQSRDQKLMVSQKKHSVFNKYNVFELSNQDEIRCIYINQLILMNSDENPNSISNIKQIQASNYKGNIFVNILSSSNQLHNPIINTYYQNQNISLSEKSAKDLNTTLRSILNSGMTNEIIYLDFRQPFEQTSNFIYVILFNAIYLHLSPAWVSALSFSTLGSKEERKCLSLKPGLCPYIFSYQTVGLEYQRDSLIEQNEQILLEVINSFLEKEKIDVYLVTTYKDYNQTKINDSDTYPHIENIEQKIKFIISTEVILIIVVFFLMVFTLIKIFNSLFVKGQIQIQNDKEKIIYYFLSKNLHVLRIQDQQSSENQNKAFLQDNLLKDEDNFIIGSESEQNDKQILEKKSQNTGAEQKNQNKSSENLPLLQNDKQIEEKNSQNSDNDQTNQNKSSENPSPIYNNKLNKTKIPQSKLNVIKIFNEKKKQVKLVFQESKSLSQFELLNFQSLSQKAKIWLHARYVNSFELFLKSFIVQRKVKIYKEKNLKTQIDITKLKEGYQLFCYLFNLQEELIFTEELENLGIHSFKYQFDQKIVFQKKSQTLKQGELLVQLPKQQKQKIFDFIKIYKEELPDSMNYTEFILYMNNPILLYIQEEQEKDKYLNQDQLKMNSNDQNDDNNNQKHNINHKAPQLNQQNTQLSKNNRQVAPYDPSQKINSSINDQEKSQTREVLVKNTNQTIQDSLKQNSDNNNQIQFLQNKEEPKNEEKLNQIQDNIYFSNKNQNNDDNGKQQNENPQISHLINTQTVQNNIISENQSEKNNQTAIDSEKQKNDPIQMQNESFYEYAIESDNLIEDTYDDVDFYVYKNSTKVFAKIEYLYYRGYDYFLDEEFLQSIKNLSGDFLKPSMFEGLNSNNSTILALSKVIPQIQVIDDTSLYEQNVKIKQQINVNFLNVLHHLPIRRSSQIFPACIAILRASFLQFIYLVSPFIGCLFAISFVYFFVKQLSKLDINSQFQTSHEIYSNLQNYSFLWFVVCFCWILIILFYGYLFFESQDSFTGVRLNSFEGKLKIFKEYNKETMFYQDRLYQSSTICNLIKHLKLDYLLIFNLMTQAIIIIQITYVTIAFIILVVGSILFPKVQLPALIFFGVLLGVLIQMIVNFNSTYENGRQKLKKGFEDNFIKKFDDFKEKQGQNKSQQQIQQSLKDVSLNRDNIFVSVFDYLEDYSDRNLSEQELKDFLEKIEMKLNQFQLDQLFAYLYIKENQIQENQIKENQYKEILQVLFDIVFYLCNLQNRERSIKVWKIKKDLNQRQFGLAMEFLIEEKIKMALHLLDISYPSLYLKLILIIFQSILIAWIVYSIYYGLSSSDAVFDFGSNSIVSLGSVVGIIFSKKDKDQSKVFENEDNIKSKIEIVEKNMHQFN